MRFLTAILATMVLASPAAAEFKLSFGWGNIPACTTGRPNRVGSPEFILRDVPEGTTVLQFKLVDRDVPGFNHGGGKVKVKTGGSFKIPFGTFKYKSPCPPNGVHTYEWTVTAKAGRKTLDTAAARRKYPE